MIAMRDIRAVLKISTRMIIPAPIKLIEPEKAKIAVTISARNIITVCTARVILIDDEYAIAEEKVSKRDSLVPS